MKIFERKYNLRLIIEITFLTLIYALIRYNVFKGVPWIDAPIYTFNKAIALTSVILLAILTVLKRINLTLVERTWFVVYLYIIAHVIFSLIILKPEYYHKFFEGNKLNITGMLTMLSGTLSFICFLASGVLHFYCKISGKPKDNLVWLHFFSLFFVILHVFFMGYKGWVIIEKWPGYMIPISLLAFVVLLFPLIRSFRRLL